MSAEGEEVGALGGEVGIADFRRIIGAVGVVVVVVVVVVIAGDCLFGKWCSGVRAIFIVAPCITLTVVIDTAVYVFVPVGMAIV